VFARVQPAGDEPLVVRARLEERDRFVAVERYLDRRAEDLHGCAVESVRQRVLLGPDDRESNHRLGRTLSSVIL
jgi:hypothetical protein